LFLSNVGWVNTAGTAYKVWGDGTNVYLADYGELRAYTFNGTTFTAGGHLDPGAEVYDVWGDGTNIYVANNTDGLRAYSYAASTFTLKDTVHEGGSDGNATAVWGDGTYIYLANDTDGLRAYTFNGTTFTAKGNVAPVGTNVVGVWGANGYIYTADYSGALTAYTFNGTTFTQKATITDAEDGQGNSIWGDGAYIYYAKAEAGLIAYTFNGSAFTKVGSVTTGGNSATTVWGDGSYIYLSVDWDSLRTYTFNGTSFNYVGVNREGNDSNYSHTFDQGVWGYGGYIYLANGMDGLRAYVHGSTDTVTATANVSNVAPISSNVSINNGDATVTLAENTPTTVTVSASVFDANGCADIDEVDVKLFRTAVTASCSSNANNCYTATATLVAGTCTDSSDLSADYTASIPVQYYADPTDVGAVYAADNWSAQVIPHDEGVGTAGTNDTIEMATLIALNVTSTIAYGTIPLGGNTAGVNQTTVVTNTGNAQIGPQVNSGAATTAMTCTTGSIPVANEMYDVDSMTYGSMTHALTGTAVSVGNGFVLPKTTTGTASTDSLYWGLAMPSSSVTGTCSGTVVFTPIQI